MRSRPTSAATSATVQRRPAISRARAGHASAHFRHAVQPSDPTAAPAGSGPPGRSQASAHAPQSRQRAALTSTSGSNAIPSGLWHQGQRSGHPLRKTVVRIPGPS